MKKLSKLLFAFALLFSVGAMAAQNSIVIPNTGTLSGLSLVNKVNDAFVTLNTGWSGASAPSSPVTGQVWLDTSVAGYISAKRYDGTQWVSESLIDSTNHVLFNPIGGGSSSIASAATTDIGSKTEALISVTGTTTITSFGSSLPTGQSKVLVFSGALTLTYNATSMILPGGASITTEAGDTAVVTSLGGGNYRVIAYTRASGSPIGTTAIANGGTGSTTASGARTNLDVYSKSEVALLMQSGRLAGVQALTASGTYTKTSGAVSGLIDMVGGGGAGAGVAGSQVGAGGGGAGERRLVYMATLPSTQAFTIGAGGTGVAGGTGNSGGDTIFGSYTAKGGTGAVTSIGNMKGGAGGTGGTGGTGFNGSAGMCGFRSGDASGIGGNGGSTPYGEGGIGAYNALTGSAGGTASGYGAGGGGASSYSSTTQAGGDGAGGIIIIYEYY